MTNRVDRLTFVYDADGTVVGELRYWFGTLFGAEHCSLCDITHSRWRKRPEFRRCAESVGIPIEYLHRDDLDESLHSLTAGRLPCVLAHRGESIEVVLDRHELGPLHGDVSAFEHVLRNALGR